MRFKRLGLAWAACVLGVAGVSGGGIALGCGGAERPVFTEAPATTVTVPPPVTSSQDRKPESPIADDASDDMPLADDGMGGDVGTTPPTPAVIAPWLGTTPRTINAARDPRVRNHAPRSRAMMVTELQGLQSLLSATPQAAPDRPALIRRLAEDYAELERGALATGGSTDPVARSSRTQAIAFYTQLEAFPAYPKLDEALYFKGLELEMGGDLTNARRAFFDLIRKFPQSKFVTYSYFAFGEMFFDEAAADPSKLDLALQAYNEVLKQPTVPLAPESLLRSAQIAEKKGEKPRALGLYKRLLQTHPGTPAASAVPAWARVP
jgi:TolA-binding protein